MTEEAAAAAAAGAATWPVVGAQSARRQPAAAAAAGGAVRAALAGQSGVAAADVGGAVGGEDHPCPVAGRRTDVQHSRRHNVSILARCTLKVCPVRRWPPATGWLCAESTWPCQWTTTTHHRQKLPHARHRLLHTESISLMPRPTHNHAPQLVIIMMYPLK